MELMTPLDLSELVNEWFSSDHEDTGGPIDFDLMPTKDAPSLECPEYFNYEILPSLNTGPLEQINGPVQASAVPSEHINAPVQPIEDGITTSLTPVMALQTEDNIESLIMDILQVEEETGNASERILSEPVPPLSVSLPVTGGKLGCKAFGFVEDAAVRETHGNPKLQALGTNGTDILKLYGIVPVNTNIGIVPDEVTSTDTCGTVSVDLKLPTVPKDITTNSYGTVSIDPKLATVPDNVTCIITCPSPPCGTTIDTRQSVVPDSATSTPDTSTEVKGVAKKRRRHRLVECQGQKKEKLYELGPQTDAKVERKRQDAIRAKKCRDKKSETLKELQDKLDVMRSEKNQLLEEIKGRKVYEETLCAMLKLKNGIVILPYGTPSDQPVLVLQP